MASKPFNVAVVGYGLSAKVFHIPLILALPEDFKLYGVVQRTPKPDDDAAKDHQGIKTWRSVDEVYTDPEVDVVIVTTTPETHFDMAKKSMESELGRPFRLSEIEPSLVSFAGRLDTRDEIWTWAIHS